MELVKEKRKHVDKKGSENLPKMKVKQKGKKVEKEEERSDVHLDSSQLNSTDVVEVRKESEEGSKSTKESLTSLKPATSTISTVEEKVEKKVTSQTSLPEKIISNPTAEQQLSTFPQSEDKTVIDIKTSKEVLASTILLSETTKSSLDPIPQDNSSSMNQNKPDEIEIREKPQSEHEKVYQPQELKVSLEQSEPINLENPKQPILHNTIQSSNPTSENISEEPAIQILSPSENTESEKESCQQSELENQVEVKMEPNGENLKETEEKKTTDDIKSVVSKSEEKRKNEESTEKLQSGNQEKFSKLEKEETSRDVEIKSATENSTESKSSNLSLDQEKPEINDKKIPSESKKEELENINNDKDMENEKGKVKQLDDKESLEETKEEKGKSSTPVENSFVKEMPNTTPEAVTHNIPISLHPLNKIPTQLSYKITADNPEFYHFQQNQIPRANQQVKNEVSRTPFAITGTDNISASASISQPPISESEHKDSIQISSSLTEEHRVKILQEPELREFINIPEFQSQFKVPNYKILHLQNLRNSRKFQRTNSSISHDEKVPLPITWKKLSEDLGFECLDTEQDEAIAFYNMILWDDLLPPRPTVPVPVPPSQKTSHGQIQGGFSQNNQSVNGRPAMSVMSDFFQERETLRKDSCMNGFCSESETLIDKDSTYPQQSWEYSGTVHQYGQYPSHRQHYYSNTAKSHKNSSYHHPHCDMAQHQHHHSYESGYESPRHHQQQHHQHHHHHHRQLLGTLGNSNNGRSDEAPILRGKRCRVYTTTAANLRARTRLRAIKNNIEGQQLENSETTTGVPSPSSSASPSSSFSPWMKTKRMFSKARTAVRSALRIKGKTEDVDDRNINMKVNGDRSKKQTPMPMPMSTDPNPVTNGEKRVESDFFLPDIQSREDDNLQRSNNTTNNTTNENTHENDTHGMDEFMRDFYYHMDLIDEEMLLAAVQAPDPPTTPLQTTTATNNESDSESKTNENENKPMVKIIDTNGFECEQISISNNKETDKK